MAKPWHKKHIPTKWGVIILGVLLLGILIGVSQIDKTQNFSSRAYQDKGEGEYSVLSCKDIKAVCLDREEDALKCAAFNNNYSCGGRESNIQCCTQLRVQEGSINATKRTKSRVKVRPGKTYSIEISGKFTFSSTLHYDAQKSDKGKKGNECYCVNANPIKWREIDGSGKVTWQNSSPKPIKGDVTKHTYIFTWKARHNDTQYLEMYISDSSYSDNSGSLDYKVVEL